MSDNYSHFTVKETRFKEAKELAQGHGLVGDRAENKCIVHKACITAQDALLTKHMTFNKSFS